MHAFPKQNGTFQSNGSSVQKQLLPIKNEKLNAKENSQKELVHVPKYPKLKLNGFVGFASLPYQVVRRSQQRGYV